MCWTTTLESQSSLRGEDEDDDDDAVDEIAVSRPTAALFHLFCLTGTLHIQHVLVLRYDSLLVLSLRRFSS